MNLNNTIIDVNNVNCLDESQLTENNYHLIQLEYLHSVK